MTHLGERVGSLVDGELGHAARERALAHLTACDRCRAEVEAERRLKGRLSGTLAPGAQEQLLRRLREIPVLGLPADAGDYAVWRLPTAAVLAAPTRGRGRYVAIGVAASVATVLSAAFAAGGNAPAEGPAIRPAVDTYTVQHAATTGNLPLSTTSFGTGVTISFLQP